MLERGGYRNNSHQVLSLQMGGFLMDYSSFTRGGDTVHPLSCQPKHFVFAPLLFLQGIKTLEADPATSFFSHRPALFEPANRLDVVISHYSSFQSLHLYLVARIEADQEAR